MSNLLIRILTLPFTVLSLVLSRIFRGFPARLAWASHGGGSGSSSSHSGMHGEVDDKMIVDPTESSKFFLKLLRTYREGDGVDVESEGIWETRGGYNAALRRAKDDNMILMVVLISKEHEDNSRFIQQTLCSHAFKQLIQEHRDSLLLWGGEVCSSRDAHIASTVLQAATFPFVAFLSSQPIPASRITGSISTTASSKVQVFSRLEGLQPTSVPHLSQHLSETVLPRLNPFLNQLRSQKRERENQRRLKEEQDRAYAESSKRDYERVQAKERELRLAREAEERRKSEETLRRQEQSNRQEWRTKVAASFGAEPNEGGVRLVIRLPDGKRLIRRFSEQEDARRIWYFIECEAHGHQVGIPSTMPSSSSSTITTSSVSPSYHPKLTFSLARTFPRKLLTFQSIVGKTVGQLVEDGSLDKGVANLIVEGLSQSGRRTDDEAGDEEDDEILDEED